MKELSPLKCMRCEGEWVPKVENPRQCPLCKSPLWNTPYRRGPKKPPASVPKLEHYIKDTSEQEVVAASIEEVKQEIRGIEHPFNAYDLPSGENRSDEIFRPCGEPIVATENGEDVFLVPYEGIELPEPEPLSYAEQVKLAIERMRK